MHFWVHFPVSSSLYSFLARWKGAVISPFSFSFPGWTNSASPRFLSCTPAPWPSWWSFTQSILFHFADVLQWGYKMGCGDSRWSLPAPASGRSWWGCSSAASCAEQLSNPKIIWKHNAFHSSGQLCLHKQSFLKILETPLQPKRNKEFQDRYGKENNTQGMTQNKEGGYSWVPNYHLENTLFILFM